jgi:hypothetical protein
VNKAVWSQCSWDPKTGVRDILMDYARFFFRSDLAEKGADGILALEKNWIGPLPENGGVPATLEAWEEMEKQAPELDSNWRFQMGLVRAVYDEYDHDRLIYEAKLEDLANAALVPGAAPTADEAMANAQGILDRAVSQPVRPELRKRIDDLYDALFHSIGLQSSVKKYQASGTERGCSLDTVDVPLNNRWWLEDEFKKIQAMPTEAEKRARLDTIRTWEHPGPGSFYDDIGNVEKCSHVMRGEGLNTDPEMERDPNPGYWWWDSGFSRARLSWQVTMDWPLALVYVALDPQADYVLRLTGCGEAFVRANGESLKPTLYGKEIGQIKEFPIPRELIKDGSLRITFDRPQEEELNWRQQSRLAEAWLLKK